MNPMKKKENPPLDEMFHHIVKITIDDKGVYPFPAIWRAEGRPDVVAALCVDDSKEVFRAISKFLQLGAQEIIFGIDRYTKPGQGNKHPDTVTVYSWSDKTGWKFGVLDYEYVEDGENIVEEINWENRFWVDRMGKEITGLIISGIDLPPIEEDQTDEEISSATWESLRRGNPN